MANGNDNTEQPKILVVDDDEQICTSLRAVLESNQFKVTTAGNVGEALHLIGTEPFDVLLSDVHMSGAADGFTVVSAMRRTQPEAVTLMFAGYPALNWLDSRLADSDVHRGISHLAGRHFQHASGEPVQRGLELVAQRSHDDGR